MYVDSLRSRSKLKYHIRTFGVDEFKRLALFEPFWPFSAILKKKVIFYEKSTFL